MKGIKLLVIFIIVAAAVLVGICVFTSPKKEGRVNTYTTTNLSEEDFLTRERVNKMSQAKELPQQNNKILTELKAKKFLSDADADFRYDRDLSFDRIDSYYIIYIANIELLTHLDNYLMNGKMCPKLIDYYKLTQAIHEGNVETIRQYCQDDNFNILPGHRKKLKLMLESKKSITLFIDNHTSIKTFRDIESLYRSEL